MCIAVSELVCDLKTNPPFRDFLALYLNCAIIATSYRWNLI